MPSTLILQLARGIWAIEPSHAEAFKPVVHAILNGNKVDFSSLMPNALDDSEEESEESMKRKNKFFVFASSPSIHSTYNKIEDAPRGSVAVTPLRGVVMKNNYCGAPGTKTLNSWMQEADKNENIIGHILYIDSPGGSVDGTMDFSESIKSLNKPVVAYVDGLMASAAYWIGSSAKHIMASNSLNQIGSIGTYITLTDWSGYDERVGIKEISIYATKSTEKNIEYREALKGNESLMKAKLDVFNEAFLKGVTKNRFGKSLDKENTLKGQLHFSEDAIKYGLIDSIGSFSNAVQLVSKLTKSK